MTVQSVLKSFWCCWIAAEVSCFLFIYLTNYLEINICHGLRAVIQSLRFRNQSSEGISKCRCVIKVTNISKRKDWNLKKPPGSTLLFF